MFSLAVFQEFSIHNSSIKNTNFQLCTSYTHILTDNFNITNLLLFSLHQFSIAANPARRQTKCCQYLNGNLPCCDWMTCSHMNTNISSQKVTWNSLFCRLFISIMKIIIDFVFDTHDGLYNRICEEKKYLAFKAHRFFHMINLNSFVDIPKRDGFDSKFWNLHFQCAWSSNYFRKNRFCFLNILIQYSPYIWN